METQNMFSSEAKPMPFAGAEYDEARDCDRLTTQVSRIHGVAIDGSWRTIQKLVVDLRKLYPKAHFPENSVQAQLRNLKKIGFQLERRNIATRGCLFEFRLLPPVNPGVGKAIRDKALGVTA